MNRSRLRLQRNRPAELRRQPRPKQRRPPRPRKTSNNRRAAVAGAASNRASSPRFQFRSRLGDNRNIPKRRFSSPAVKPTLHYDKVSL
jgi:hypothetical protein